MIIIICLMVLVLYLELGLYEIVCVCGLGIVNSVQACEIMNMIVKVVHKCEVLATIILIRSQILVCIIMIYITLHCSTVTAFTHNLLAALSAVLLRRTYLSPCSRCILLQSASKSQNIVQQHQTSLVAEIP